MLVFLITAGAVLVVVLVLLLRAVSNRDRPVVHVTERDVRELVERGRLDEATAAYSQLTGEPAARSRDAVEAMVLGESLDLIDMAAARERASDAAVLEAVRAGNKIEAIKHYRALYRVDLKTAQDAVDAIERQQR